LKEEQAQESAFLHIGYKKLRTCYGRHRFKTAIDNMVTVWENRDSEGCGSEPSQNCWDPFCSRMTRAMFQEQNLWHKRAFWVLVLH